MPTLGLSLNEPIRSAESSLRPKTVIVAAIAGFIGIALGIGLTIVTVLIPRRAELSREARGSSFLQGFSVVDSMKAIAPTRVWTGKEEGMNDNSGNAFGPADLNYKSFMGTMKVPAAEQSSLVTQLSRQILADLQRRRTATLISRLDNRAYVTGMGNLNAYHACDYLKPRGAGSIQVWGIGRGDDLTITVSISER